MIKKALLVTVGLALSSSVSSAALTWTTLQTFSYTNTGGTVPFPAQSIIISPFDTATYGPLVAVRLSLTGTISGSQQVDNNDTQAANATVKSAITMNLALDGFGNLVVAIPDETHTPLLQPNDFVGVGEPDYDGADSFTNVFSGVADTDTQMYDLARFVAAEPIGGLGSLQWQLFVNTFAGSGDITLDLTSSGVTQASGGGNLESTFITVGNVQGYIQYGYDSPVPEPGTYAMLGGGLALLGLIGRRRLRA